MTRTLLLLRVIALAAFGVYLWAAVPQFLRGAF